MALCETLAEDYAAESTRLDVNHRRLSAKDGVIRLSPPFEELGRVGPPKRHDGDVKGGGLWRRVGVM